MNNNKQLLARYSVDSKNVLTITTYAESEKDIILDTVFLKFSHKKIDSDFISLQVKIFDIRVLVNIIKQVISLVKIIQEKNKLISLKNEKIEIDNKKNNTDIKLINKELLEFTSKDTIITNKTQNKEDQKTITVAFQKNTLFINSLYKNKQISLGFKKIEIEPLIESLNHLANYSSSEYYKYCSSL